MTPEQFTYWLQGFMEVQDPESLNEEQTQIIKDHLAMVFDKKTPDRRGKVKPLKCDKPKLPHFCNSRGSLKVC